MPEAEQYQVLRLGIAGDGIIETPSGAQFVPGALPGDRVTRSVQGGWDVIAASSPQRRREPLCPHVGKCGGCSLQHMSEDLYRAWKAGLLPEALRMHGLDAEIAPMLSVPLRSRRRAVLTARRSHGRVALGFHRLRSHDIEPISACAVLSQAIMAELPVLNDIAGILLPADGEARVSVIAADRGLDADFDGVKARPGPEERLAISNRLRATGILRLALGGDPLIVREEPTLKIGGVDVVSPPGAFVQAVSEAEAAMRDLAVAAIGKAKRVADLFSGIGTFTLGLARRARVLAVDSDRHLIGALQAAHKKAQGLKPIGCKIRDLMADPLSPKELEDFDAVLFDPPRAGAKRQAEALARSKVKTVIAVSCNPATLARDLRLLVDGDYRIEAVTPIDQFLYTPHLEAVAVLRR